MWPKFSNKEDLQSLKEVVSYMARLLAAAGVIWLVVAYYDMQKLSVAATVVCLIGFLSMAGVILLENYVEKKTSLNATLKRLNAKRGKEELTSGLEAVGQARWGVVIAAAVMTVVCANLGDIDIHKYLGLRVFLFMLMLLGLLFTFLAWTFFRLMNAKAKAVRRMMANDEKKSAANTHSPPPPPPRRTP